MKRMLRITGLIAAGSLLVLTAVFWSIPSRQVRIRIPNGASALQVTALFHAEGLILSRTLFMAGLKITGGIHSIKAGDYVFSSRTLTPMIIRRIIKGRTVFTNLTIPEGLTFGQTADHLQQKGFGDAEVYRRIFADEGLEGYLFPETYVFSHGLHERQITDMLLEQFNRTFVSAWEDRAAELGLTKDEVVILASIIEKEAKADHERPLISAVFHNRLSSRKYLESCATVQYALGRWKKRLYHKDLKVESPYNTYIHAGLPPGPICSPGRRSLEAALFPDKTDALFFISNGDGTHSFYSRYRDHLKGKKEYKEMIHEYRKRQRREAGGK